VRTFHPDSFCTENNVDINIALDAQNEKLIEESLLNGDQSGEDVCLVRGWKMSSMKKLLGFKAESIVDRWLTDETINTYFALLQEESNSLDISSARRRYFCSSYFYQKLSESGYNYENVRRWNKKQKVDIFECSHLFIPISEKNRHWFLVVVDLATREIKFYDSLGAQTERDHEIFTTLCKYLDEKYMEERGMERMIPWTMRNW